MVVGLLTPRSQCVRVNGTMSEVLHMVAACLHSSTLYTDQCPSLHQDRRFNHCQPALWGGAGPWSRTMEKDHGAGPWSRTMEQDNGAGPWSRTMEQDHGAAPFFGA
uniref:Uncharacterized protein n=1 Tax=Knipowitschia caucasica TaxID=637954 RepID=A0AAV2MEG2_KNICA